MLELLWVLLPVATGAMLLYRFAGLRALAPRWAAALLIAGAGAALGIGLASIIFFLSALCLPGFRFLPMLAEIGLAGWLAFEVYRSRREAPSPVPDEKRFPWTPVLALALATVLVAATMAMTNYWSANPQGNWDAWAIWNLRARFLAAGDLAPRAWSPMLSGSSHPGYPLLVSGFVGRCWSYAGTASVVAPIAAGMILFLALVAMGTGGIAALSGGSLGLLFGLAVASSPFLLHEVPAQYADIPLACYFAGALVLLLLDRPLWAGALASLAAWTKDEGLLFVLALFAVMALTRRKQWKWTLAGVAPAGAVVLLFRLFLTHGSSWLTGSGGSSAGLLMKLRDSGRYLTVAGTVIESLWNMGFGWYHPILPLLVLCVVLRFKRDWRRDVVPAGVLTGLMMLGYFMIYIVTPLDLNWQLSTSLDRLLVQLWPLFLIAVFAGLRAPEAMAVEVPAPEPKRKEAPARRSKR